MKETQETPGYDASSPPSYSYEGQQPPPYSAVPATYPTTEAEATCIHQPHTEYESFSNISPEAPSVTTPLMASSSFDDKSVRRGFVRKVCPTIIQTMSQICYCLRWKLYFLFEHWLLILHRTEVEPLSLKNPMMMTKKAAVIMYIIVRQ